MRPIRSINEILMYKTRRDINLDIFISLKNKYVYFMISKAASSTITYHLRYAEYFDTPFSVKDVNNVHMSPHILPYQLSEEHFLSILNDEDFAKVTFVRNPFTRLLSCYLHRIIGENAINPSKASLYRSLKKDLADDVSFAEFIDCITSQETKQMERHWIVQSECALADLVEHDFVGKQESLVDDLLKFEALQYPGKRFDHDLLQSVNVAPKQTKASAKLQKFYTDDLVHKVVDRYQKDFDRFDYSTALPA